MPTQNAELFDLVVLGAGSGGMAAAKRAAKLGAKVAIIERERVGGTCVLRGCIPKKLMVYAAELVWDQRLFADFGLRSKQLGDDFSQVDWPTLVEHREALIAKLENSHSQTMTKLGVTPMAGEAAFVAPDTLRVGPNTVRAKSFLIATGAQASRGTWPGAQHSMTSDDFFRATCQPKHVIIVGGGYIAVELAGILARLGTACTLVCRSTLLRAFDHDLVQGMREALVHLGVTLLEHTAVEGQDHHPTETLAQTLSVKAQGQTHQLHGDWVVTALGRTPSSQNLGLDAAGVGVNAQGGIETNSKHQTQAPHIFAVGDVTGRHQLTPVAIREGRRVAHHLFDGTQGGPAAIRPDEIPTAVFGAPPMASVGLTESQARTRHGADVAVRMTRYTPLRASMGAKTEGPKAIIKVVSRPSDDRVLGFHMLGDDAPEIVQGLAVSLACEVTLTQLDATVALHPSQAEEFVLLGAG